MSKLEESKWMGPMASGYAQMNSHELQQFVPGNWGLREDENDTGTAMLSENDSSTDDDECECVDCGDLQNELSQNKKRHGLRQLAFVTRYFVQLGVRLLLWRLAAKCDALEVAEQQLAEKSAVKTGMDSELEELNSSGRLSATLVFSAD